MEQAAKNPVVIVDYNPLWPEQFETLRARLAIALGGLALTIEHVGSTAVPGLSAKPILDIDVLLKSSRGLPLAISALSSIGYQHRGDLGIPGRDAFREPAGSLRHHLYVCPDNREYQRHITFRNHLRSHPEDASAYGILKRELAIRFRDDREAYNDAKSDFVERILRTLANEKALSKLAVSSDTRYT
jgi:GrpB-like predicted nucleotidyltransferase (UPF0157 family)